MKKSNGHSPESSWKFFIDTGGTFTDCLAESPGGQSFRSKVLSSSAIRGVISEHDSKRRFTIKLNQKISGKFFTGYSILFLELPDSHFTITDSDGMKITINSDLPEVLTDAKAIPFEIYSPEEAPVFATRIITNTPLGNPLPPLNMRLSTTKGTNALLERQGAKSLFFITEGFGDLLRIRNQQRPDLFSLNIQKTVPFYSKIIEVPERLNADGSVLKGIDLDELKIRIKPHLAETESAGICLMHSYLNPDHEKKLESLLTGLDVKRISRSSALSPTIKIVPRATTTDVNAFLSPVMENYLESISGVLGDSQLKIMTSAGSLADSASYCPKDGLLSGPAGGVIGAAAIGKRVSKSLSGLPHKKNKTHVGSEDVSKENLTGFEKIISFDMGGTSTDVARYDESIDYHYEHTVGDATLSAPAVEIETVAAGGGSICEFDGQSLTVGPESAGAEPGPACYGRGGPLTITDVNLLSGRLHPQNFHISILPGEAEKRLEELMIQINSADSDQSGSNKKMSRKQVLDGFLDIANERMAQAIRKISIQKGFNPAEYAMVAFGGAGAQHALAVAKKLGIRNVLVPADAGLLSAYGLQQARLEEISTQQVLQPLESEAENLSDLFSDLGKEATEKLKKQGVNRKDIIISQRRIFLRFKGQDHSLEIDFSDADQIEKDFKAAYEEQYGHWIENRDIEIEAIRVKVSENSSLTRGDKGDWQSPIEGGKVCNTYQGDDHDDFETKEHPSHRQQMHLSAYSPQGEISQFQTIYLSNNIKPETKLSGPALILDSFTTTVIETGWDGILLDDRTWLLRDFQDSKKSEDLEEKKSKEQQRSEAVNLQLYTNRFRAVADQMGEMLRKTSMSVNVKERLDFSCALLDADGYLVVNAPHIPVHLGAMGTCVRSLIRFFEGEKGILSTKDLIGLQKLAEGDVLITNHPGFGGSHLPDVTIVTPVFYNGKRIGFTASRAHHSEMGGKRPGSMPPDATNLAEEGVVIPPIFLARKGKFDWTSLEKLLKNSRWPSRAPEENLADIRAAVAANHRGVLELQKLAGTFGSAEVTEYMIRLKEYAKNRMSSTLQKIEDGTYRAEEKLDDGSVLKAECSIKNSSMKIDFTGTSDVHPGNLNANPSIVNSVVMYVLRLLIDEPLPLNDGLLEPVEITIPKGMLNPDFPDDPAECPAVVGGNIETSQRLSDTLIKAFGLSACSYGTMNNVLFGNDSFGYYETVAGGIGAGNGFHGADAVHQHMTNTRATDPEIFEHRYPVRLNRYAIRMNSGGAGKWNGGNGLIRDITFLEPVSLSVLSQHRVVPPYGMDGGKPGKTGKNMVERRNGSTKVLKWKDGTDLKKGDRFILKTPGGGGFGSQ